MNIIVVGLGLIGGSFCKALSAYTNHSCYGIDSNPLTVAAALADGAIVGEGVLSEGDLVLICLYPEGVSDFLESHINDFKPGAMIVDACGVKSGIVGRCEALAAPAGLDFLGGHPMAGRELSGYEASLTDLFKAASFIVTPTEKTSPEILKTVEELALAMGFGRVVVSTPPEHDRIIAYTSQLPHVVSNAYLKSPAAKSEGGFSAGSFRDFTRVARLNVPMWSALFLENREPLLRELDTLMENLAKVRSALSDSDRTLLEKLLTLDE